jgi:hypothetical protein
MMSANNRLGLGESLAGDGVIAWRVGLVGPARSGSVPALIGVAIYGAFAVGGPIGQGLLDWFDFAGAMAISAVLPCLGLLAMWPIARVAAPPMPSARHTGARSPGSGCPALSPIFWASVSPRSGRSSPRTFFTGNGVMWGLV